MPCERGNVANPVIALCPGYEGIYIVTSEGDVARQLRSQGAAVGLVLKPALDGRGYPCVGLRKGGKQRWEKVHRLVCAAFHGPAPNGRGYVNHKDGDKANNKASNLEWVSAAENAIHAHANGLTRPAVGEQHGKAQAVYRIGHDGSATFFPTIKAACESTPGARRDRVWEAATPGKKLKAHAGYRWRYA